MKQIDERYTCPFKSNHKRIHTKRKTERDSRSETEEPFQDRIERIEVATERGRRKQRRTNQEEKTAVGGSTC
jgi:hypothetical protein